MIKKIHYMAGILILILAGSAQAISFRDYYHGNAELGIPSHEKEVNDAIETGKLDLSNKALTDLIGFNEIPGITLLWRLDLEENQLIMLPDNVFRGFSALKTIDLNDNQLTAVPANIFRDLSAVESLSLANNLIQELSQNVFHGLTALEDLNISNNQLTALPFNIFQGLTALRDVAVFNNPIPLTQEQLRKELQLPDNISLRFKTPSQEWVEKILFAAIGNADASNVRYWLDEIKAERFKSRKHQLLGIIMIISKIRDAKGDNLLHAAIRDAAERIGGIDRELGTIRRDEKLSTDEKQVANDVLLDQKREINDRYMKVISAILSCGEECVQDMLFTPNVEGQQVIDAVVAKLGFDSPIYKAILEGLTPDESPEAHPSAHTELGKEPEKKIRMEEAEEATMHPRPKRTLEQTVSEVEPMVDVEVIEKEQEEEGKRQKPNEPEEQ